MKKAIFTLHKKLADISAKICCLCYNHVNEGTACVKDFVVLNCDDVQELSRKEEVEIHYILEKILGSKVAAYLAKDDLICNQCVQSAISSYKFINTCRENAESMVHSVEAFSTNLELTDGIEMQDYNTLFIIIDSEEAAYTQYYDTAKFANSNAALYKFQTLFRQYRKIVDTKGNTKYKCTKCQSVFINQSRALTHFNLKHIEHPEVSLKDEISYSDDDNNICTDDDTDWTESCNIDDVGHHNEISYEVIIDCDGVNKYKCKLCDLIYSTARNARRHYKTKHETENDTSLRHPERVEIFKLENDGSKPKIIIPDYLTDFINCKDKQTTSNNETESKIINKDKYTCVNCNEIYKSKYILIKHILKEHAIESSEICDTTLEEIDVSGNKIYDHIYTKVKHENGSENFRCKVCLKLYNSYQNCKIHFNNIHVTPQVEDVEYVCNQCGKGLKTIALLNRHQERHGNSKVICGTCNKEFKNKCYFKDHIIICSEVNKLISSQPKYICKLCGKGYNSRQSRYKHIKLNHDPHSKKFPCQLCSKEFGNRTRLRNHQVTHTRERNFTCDICGDVFVAKNALLYHTRLHTGERPYKCTQCDLRFLSASRRADHMRRIHIAAMAVCSICGVTLKQTGMPKHMRRQHGIGIKKSVRIVSVTSQKEIREATDRESVSDSTV